MISFEAKRPPASSSWLWLGVLAALGIAAFAQSVSGQFLPWDDDINITRNPHLAPLSGPNLQWMFTDVQSAQRYKPLTWLAWSLTERWAGMHAPAFHAASIGLHVVNAALVFLLLRALLELRGWFRPRPPAPEIAAFAGAALWELHPLRVEPVAWISGTGYLLCACFGLLCVLAYLRTWRTGGADRARWLMAAVFAYVLSLLSYPAALLLPALLCAVDWLVLRWAAGSGSRVLPGFRRLAAEKVLFLAPAAALLAITLAGRAHARGIWHAPKAIGEVGLPALGVQAAYVWTHYVVKTLWPSSLSPVYLALWGVDPSAPRFVLSALFVGAASACAVLARGRVPEAAALWFSYLALLIPALGFTELPHFPCDRYSYIPSLCLAAAVAFGLAPLLGSERAARPALACVAACAGLFAWRDTIETVKWHDARALFYRAIDTIGDHPYRADLYWRMGAAYLNQGQDALAVAEFDKALAIRQDAHLPRYFRAVGRYNLGRFREAAGDFETILALEEASPTAFDAGIPTPDGIRFNLASSYAKAGMWKEALASRPAPGGLPPARLIPLYDEIAAGLRSAGMEALAAAAAGDSAAAAKRAEAAAPAGRPPASAR